MNRIIGHFVFQKRKDGSSITGRYSHRNLDVIFTHQATLVNKSEGDYCGEYVAEWNEISSVDTSRLTIEFKQGTDNEIYILRWEGGNMDYTGEGFILNGVLIGSYVSL